MQIFQENMNFKFICQNFSKIKIMQVFMRSLMVHSDFIAVHRSTSADATFTSTLRVVNICACNAGSHAKD